MKKLIFETSTEKSSLALIDENTLIAQLNFFGGPGLSEKLAPAVQDLIQKFSFKCDAIVLGIGPGSFTGIRVGASLAHSLSIGWNIPLWTAPSLSAFSFETKEKLAVLFDARSGGLYVQSNAEKTPFLLPAEEVLEKLKEFKHLASPHPEKIKKRFCLEHAKWHESSPDLLRLSNAATLHPEEAPLSPIYLSQLIVV